MKHDTNRGRRPGTPPRRASRGRASPCNRGSLSTPRAGAAKSRAANAKRGPHSNADRNTPQHAAQDSALHQASPPPTSLSSGTNSLLSAHRRPGRTAGASEEKQLATEDTDTKDGMRGPPSRRPPHNRPGYATAPSVEESRAAAEPVTAVRALHSLAPPPRRRLRPVAKGASSTTSSSSRHRSSTVSSDDDDEDNRKLCERCAHLRRKQEAKRHHNLSTPHSRVMIAGKHVKTSSDASSLPALALSSRRSHASRSSQTKQRPPHAAQRRPNKERRDSFSSRSSLQNSDGSDAISRSSTEQGCGSGGDNDDDDDEERSTSVSDSASEDERLHSSSSSAASVCALTDTLPRELYLHICSFLDEVACCTLLEVSLRMHAAITSADSYVWRRLCMSTWRYKQGFQTFIQRVKALESLAWREEREVQALQQHMLLLREQGTFFGASDVSATCDDATVLLRRRQHERAQWAAAAAGAASPSPVPSCLQQRRLTAVGSSTTSASSTTDTTSEEDEDDDESVRWQRRYTSRRTTTHRTSTAAATASTTRRRGGHAAHSRRKPTSPSPSSSRVTHSPASLAGEHLPTLPANDDPVTAAVALASPSCSTARVSPLSTPQAAAGDDAELSGDGHSDPPSSHDPRNSQEGEVRPRERRVRIRLPEEVDQVAAFSLPTTEPQGDVRANASLLGTPKKQGRPPSPTSSRPHHHGNPASQHGELPRRQPQTQQQRPGASQPPISRHRRSHSVKRKPAKQRRRKRGRSCRPRATGGGRGRHRSRHHRSQSRHHRSARAPSSHRHHHHHHRHSAKATKSTRRRRRRQRNAAAAAAAASAGSGGTGHYPASLNGATGSGSGGVGGGRGSTHFYQTATYEAIKSTTPVLGVQYVAPTTVPSQLGGRPIAPLPRAVTAAAVNAPSVVSTLSCFSSRDTDLNAAQQTGRTATEQPVNAAGAATIAAPSGQPFALAASSVSLPRRDRGGGPVAGSTTRPPSLPLTVGAGATVSAPPTLPAVPGAEEDGEGLYWWQLTPEARHEQLRRMQQREQRQQQQQQERSTAAAAASVAPDGEEVADEAALREWDALEASFGSSGHSGNGGDDDEGEEGADDDDDSEMDGNDYDDDDDEGDGRGSSDDSARAEDGHDSSATAASSSGTSRTRSSRDEDKMSRTWQSRLRGYQHRRRHRRRRTHSGSNAATSSTSSGRTHMSPPSSLTSTSSKSRNAEEGATIDRRSGSSGLQRSTEDASTSAHRERRRHNHDGGVVASSSSGTSQRTRRSLARATSSSSSRVSAHAERKLARLLARRYEGVEEAMIITRSKSVLIHTLGRQTHAHLPHLLAAAAQRQRRVAPNAVELRGCSGAPLGDGGSGGGGGLGAVRPVLLLGGDRSPAPSPPTVGVAAAATPTPASTLPSSLSNAFPTSPGVALAVPASPLHQLPRISSTPTLADSAAHSGPQTHTACSSTPELQEGRQARNAAPPSGDRVAVIDAGRGGGSSHLTASRHSSPRLDARDPSHDDAVDDVEEEEEPLAPVSWKFAYFMSRREARRSTITLQDLLEGMWLVCFRTTGRTHPMRFTRQMRVIVYPPLPTEEEEGERGENEGEGSAEGGGGASSHGAGTAVHAVRPPGATPGGSASHPLAGRGAVTAAVTASPVTAAATAPPLPFHILQSGAQLVVHQFPPMKVLRRSVLATQGQVVSGVARGAPAAVSSAAAGGVAPRTPLAEREQRFLAEPQATLRRLRMRLLSTPTSAATECDMTSPDAAAGPRETETRRCDGHGAAEVTQASVRRTIAQQLGFATAYVTDVLALFGATSTCVGEEGRAPLEGSAAAAPPPPGTEAGLRRRHERKRFVAFGPPTLEAFEAQQRLDACFAPGGCADVLNDWGWTIAGQHVKIFSLDVKAPLYVERLQRIVDV